MKARKHPQPGQSSERDDEQVLVLTADDLRIAENSRARPFAAGISAVLTSEGVESVGGICAGGMGPVRVLVPKSRAHQATALLDVGMPQGGHTQE